MDHAKTLLATSHGAPIAIEVRNTFRLATVALGQLAATPFDPARPERDYELDIVPIAGAYVICLQRSLGGHPVSASLPVRWGRTNELGWILEPAEGCLHDDVPPAPRMPQQTIFGEPVGGESPVPAKEQMLFDSGETYDLYWSFDRERFDEIASELKRDPLANPSALASRRLVFEPRFPYPIEGLELLDNELRLRVSHFLVRNEDRGFVVGRQYGYDICLFDVTPEPLRALYLSEFLQFWTIRAMQTSAKDLATLVRGRNMAEAAQHGAPDLHMEAMFMAKPGTPEREVLDHYRDYVWQCAANGIRGPELATSLDVTLASLSLPHPDWRTTADQLGRSTNGKVVHPAFRGVSRERLLLGATAQRVLLTYYELYRLGGRIKRQGFAERVSDAIEELDSTAEATHSLIAQLLSAHASPPTFMDALDWGTPNEPSLRAELHERYLTICAAVEYAWWDALEDYRTEDWKRFSKRLKWINALPGGFGKAFKSFFDRRLKVYKLGLDAANKALTTFYRYHTACAGELNARIFEETLPTLQTKVRVDFRASTITVLKAHDGTTRLDSPIELVFTAIQQQLAPNSLTPPPGNMTRARKRRFDLAKATGQIVEYDVELPVAISEARKLGAEMPAALALVCGGLNTLFGALATFERLKQGVKLERKEIEAWYELGKNTLGVVESLAALQDAMAPKIDGYSPLLKSLTPAITKASRAVSVIDAGYNLATGLELLFSDDGAVAYELRHGREVRGLALRVKGVLQLASAAGSGAMAASLLTMFGGASATGFLAAAAGPVGLTLAAGGILIACIDSALDLTKEFGAQVSALEEALEKAARKELPTAERKLLATRRVQRVQALAQGARFG